MDLFSNSVERKQTKIGQADVSYKAASTILTEAKGFMSTYDYTLNPYSGCSFGCTYCYAAFFSRSAEQMANWGKWIAVKENAVDLLKKFGQKRSLKGKSIYMSSVTDPYQPIEQQLQLTRSLLLELLQHQPNLVIQTRSAIVTRDLDMLQRFKNVQVNMTITTDSEEVRKVFEPWCPSNRTRIDAIKQVYDAGIDACITMTPLLPVANAHEFALALKATGISRFIIQPFHSDKGKFIAGTREAALAILKRMNWGEESYNQVLSIIKQYIPEVGIGKEGFKPPK